MDTERIFNSVESLTQDMVNTLMEIIRFPAVGPESGGTGEFGKAEALMKILDKVGFDKIERVDAEDPRVPSRRRPNIVAYLKGETDAKRVWIVSHMDVVPAGEESFWKITRPFESYVKDGRIYGRGSEDNGQSLVASVYAARALKKASLKPKRTFALAIVSDEEQGSIKGIQHLIGKGLFRKDDLVYVPDHGTPEGSFIEIAEKSILWLKLTTVGKQAHGSLPDQGLNAHRVGMQAALAVDSMLHELYPARDEYFSPPTSTFEPTKKEKNVDSINIVPGEDALYFDCRILPRYDVEDVLANIQGVIADVEAKTCAKITLELVQKQVSPALASGNNEAVQLLKTALRTARGVEATVGGVGGGTCAAFFRQVGIPAVVWSTIDEVPHSPDEYSKVANMVADAKIFALLPVL